jgi:hypothetical protein
LSRGSVSADGKACVESVYARFDQFRDLFLRAAIEAADRAGAPLADWAAAECAKSGCASLASPELRAEGGCAFAARVSPSGLAWPFGIFSAWLARRRAGRARRARR